MICFLNIMHVNYSPAWTTAHPSMWIPETKVKQQSRSVKFKNTHTHTPCSRFRKILLKTPQSSQALVGMTNGWPHLCIITVDVVEDPDEDVF